MATKYGTQKEVDVNERLIAVLEELRDRLPAPVAQASENIITPGTTSSAGNADLPLSVGELRSIPTSTASGDGKSIASKILANRPDIREFLEHESAIEKIRSKLKSVSVDGEPLYIAEGDTLLDEDQLLLYAQQRAKSEEAFRWASAVDAAGLGVAQLADGAPRGLVGIQHMGKTVRWAPDTTLTYRVARDSFTSAAQYNLVVQNMTAATNEWMSTCGVRFQHLHDSDTLPGVGPNGALFVVREIDAGGLFIASAFFPNDPLNRRRILIDPSYYTTDFDKTGVLRHELGHVLGFRHEHIRSGAPAICPDESLENTIDLTQYDPQSVMHYFCGGVGSRGMRISDLDRQGAQRVYGPPLPSVEFVRA